MNTSDTPLTEKEEKAANINDSMYETIAALEPVLPELYAKLQYSMSDGDLARVPGNTVPDTAKVGIDPKKGIVIVTDHKPGMQILIYKLYRWLKNIDTYFDILQRGPVWLKMYDNEQSPAAVLEEYGYNNHQHLIIDDTS